MILTELADKFSVRPLHDSRLAALKKVSYALEGNISVSAQAAAWMAELMGLPDVAALTESATRAKGNDSVCFVPALAGLARRWKDRARAALTGMSLATSRAEVARATLEAMPCRSGHLW